MTRDGIKTPGKPLHYTVAPKDDMPFGLFLAHLKGLEASIKKLAGSQAMNELVSIQTLVLAINSMAKERQDIGARLEAGGLDDEDYDDLSDKVLRLTTALGELADVYEPQREGQEKVFPSFQKILSAYQ